MTEDGKKEKKSSIILESDLKTFFYKELDAINRSAANPLPLETIFYSSYVMDNFSVSEKYFEIEDGRVKNKILGLKLLKSSHLGHGAQKRELRDIGDSALLLCGVFSESLNCKIVDLSFYESLGATAYGRLNSLIPNELEIENFYLVLAENFKNISKMMSTVTSDFLNTSGVGEKVVENIKSMKIKMS